MIYSPNQINLVGLRAINIKLYNFLVQVDNFLTFLSSSTKQSTNTSNIVTLEYNVTAVGAITYANPIAGQVLIVLIQQGPVGYAVTWGANFQNPPIIDTTINTYTSAVFLGRETGYWTLVALPIIGIGI